MRVAGINSIIKYSNVNLPNGQNELRVLEGRKIIIAKNQFG